MATGSRPAAAVSITSTAAPIRVSTPSSPIRPGLIPTPSSRTSLPATIAAATMKNAAEEKSPGIAIRPGSSRSAGSTVTRFAGSSPWTVTGVPAFSTRHRRPCRAQHALGVVAGRPLLDHRRLAVGEQAGEQQARLHLGAGDGQAVLDAVQRRGADGERRDPAVAGFEIGRPLR